MAPTSGTVVTVQQFRFSGNTLLRSDELTPVVASYLQRPLDYVQLQAAAAAVADAYRAAGWVVNAYLPAQDIKDGIVTIQIIEAVFGNVKLEGAPSARTAYSQVEAIFAAQQKSGASLNSDALDRGLLLADDLPGTAVAGSLAAGSQPGQTDLILKMADEPLVMGQAAIDNTGSRSTGEGRATANLYINSPAGLGDLLSGSLIHTQGSDYLRLAYSLPAGSNGWRVGVSASALDYKLISLNPDKDKGTSGVVGLDATYPVVRSRLANLYLNLNADQKKFDNEFGGATTTRYRMDTTSIALNGNLFDNWGGGGANAASLTAANGRRSNEVGTTGQTFSLQRYTLSRQQVISNALSIFALMSGQESGDALDTSEQFYLGGAGSVRAYPSGEGGGDSGLLTTLELRQKLTDGWSLMGFYDQGQVRNRAASQGYSLQGFGVSVGWQTALGANFKLTWAQRMGDNPNPSSKDATEMNRFWASVTLPF